MTSVKQLVHGTPSGSWVIGHEDGSMIHENAGAENFWTTNPQHALKFETQSDAEFIARGLSNARAISAGKACAEKLSVFSIHSQNKEPVL